jgi:hypothetical protein
MHLPTRLKIRAKSALALLAGASALETLGHSSSPIYLISDVSHFMTASP